MPCLVLGDLPLGLLAHPVSWETPVSEPGTIFLQHQMEEAFVLEIVLGNFAKGMFKKQVLHLSARTEGHAVASYSSVMTSGLHLNLRIIMKMF